MLVKFGDVNKFVKLSNNIFLYEDTVLLSNNKMHIKKFKIKANIRIGINTLL